MTELVSQLVTRVANMVGLGSDKNKQAREPFHEPCILDVHTECWKNADLMFSFHCVHQKGKNRHKKVPDGARLTVGGLRGRP